MPSNWDPFIVSFPKPSEIYNKFNKDKNVDITLPPNPAFIMGSNEESADLDELHSLGWHKPNYTPATKMLPSNSGIVRY